MVSDTFVREANAESNPDPFLLLATISHPALDDTIRAVLNNVDIVSRSHTYKATGFEFTPPEENTDSFQPAHLRIDNIDPRLVAAIRTAAASGPKPLLTFEIVRAAAPNTVEMAWPDLELSNADYDAASIEGDLSLPDFSQEPVSWLRFTPDVCPGLF